jgi:hypothetical protein
MIGISSAIQASEILGCARRSSRIAGSALATHGGYDVVGADEIASPL